MKPMPASWYSNAHKLNQRTGPRAPKRPACEQGGTRPVVKTCCARQQALRVSSACLEAEQRGDNQHKAKQRRPHKAAGGAFARRCEEGDDGLEEACNAARVLLLSRLHAGAQRGVARQHRHSGRKARGAQRRA
jgi:hypothetical protein